MCLTLNRWGFRSPKGPFFNLAHHVIVSRLGQPDHIEIISFSRKRFSRLFNYTMESATLL